jgi:hypothetical protein
MKVLFFALVMLTLLACEKPQKPSFLCQAAKVATDALAGKISARWDCDADKVSMFIYKPIEDKYCSREKSMLLDAACSLIIGMVTDLGAEKISADFSCNRDKVKADLANADKLCDVLAK